MNGDGPSAPARDQAGNDVALLIIDMVQAFDFEGSDLLRPRALKAARSIAQLRQRAGAAGVPTIYVNDNFGQWHSESSRLVEEALGKANPIVELIKPARDDFFIIKPQFSGFYATNLPVLLPKLGVQRLILTGVATDVCVLFTAADAHMRDYNLWVPSDAVAAMHEERGEWALEIMRESMAADTDNSDKGAWL